MEHAPTPQRHRPMPPRRSSRPCRDWSRPRTRPPGRARRRRKAARTRPARLVARLGAVGRTARSRDSPWHPASGRAARSRKRYWSRTSQSETRRRCCTSEHPKGKAALNEVGGPERDEAGRILATVLQERTSGGGGGAGRGGGAGAVLNARRRGPGPPEAAWSVGRGGLGAFGAVWSGCSIRAFWDRRPPAITRRPARAWHLLSRARRQLLAFNVVGVLGVLGGRHYIPSWRFRVASRAGAALSGERPGKGPGGSRSSW